MSRVFNTIARFRSRFKWAFIYFLQYVGLFAVAKWWIRREGAIVLTFHRVLEENALAHSCSPSAMIVTSATFESLLRHVQQHYSIVDLANETERERERLQVAITFDDGWEDNASTAFPIARKLNVPFTIFVCPGLMHTPVPFWPERVIALIGSAERSADSAQMLHQVLISNGYSEWAATLAAGTGDAATYLIQRVKSLSFEARTELLHSLLSCGIVSKQYPNASVDRTMSWSQLAELHNAGVSFGSHSHNHEILPCLPAERMEKEISESKAALESRVGPCVLFSYPNGDASREVRDTVAKFGFKLAFINSPGVWRWTGDPFLIPRINLSEGTLVGRDGRFSTLAFDYRVFWNAFIHRQPQ